jgi:hypothetical protein
MLDKTLPDDLRRYAEHMETAIECREIGAFVRWCLLIVVRAATAASHAERGPR